MLTMKKYLLILFFFFGLFSQGYSQKKSWFVFQPNAQGKNIQFTENSVSVSSKNYPKPIHPFSKKPFNSYLSLNCQNDTQGNLIFYLLSTKDSVFLFDSTNYFIQAFDIIDISPVIIPFPDGAQYHLLIGENAYLFRIMQEIEPPLNKIQILMLTKINVNAHDGSFKHSPKRIIEIIKMDCDTQIYRVYAIVANRPGFTGRYIISTTVRTTSDDFYNPLIKLDTLDITNYYNYYFEHSISEQEISPQKNKLLFSSFNYLIVCDLINHRPYHVISDFSLKSQFNDSNLSIMGTEFLNDSIILFSTFSTNKLDSNSNMQGVYRIKLNANGFSNCIKVPNSDKFKYSYIERGLNKKIYVTYSDGLYYYNLSNNSFVKENLFSLTFKSTIPTLNSIDVEYSGPQTLVYYLPNQIDYTKNEPNFNIRSVVKNLTITKSGNFHYKNHKLTKLANGPICVLDTLQITNSAKFVNLDSMMISFHKDAKFYLLKNNHLTLKGTTLKGMCGQMWDGVRILPIDSGSIITIQKNKYGKNSMIRDAKIAGIHSNFSQNRLNIIDNTVFMANKMDIYIQNGLLENINIYNCRFLDTAIHNDRKSSTNNALTIEYSKIKIGNNLQGINQIIGGLNGIVLNNNTIVTVDNFIIDSCFENSISALKNNFINVLNSKLYHSKIGVKITSFDNFTFKNNIVQAFTDNGLLINSGKFNSILIGGSTTNKNSFNNCGFAAIEINGATSPILNSNYIGIPASVDQSSPLRPNSIINKWGNIVINNNFFYDTSQTNIGIRIENSLTTQKQIDTFQINLNKFTYGENAISINNISSMDCLNTLLPKSENIPNCYGNKNIYKNIISDNGKLNSSKIGILLKNCSNIYIGNNRILNNLNNSVGIKINNSTSCLVYSDTIFNSYIGLFTTGNNLYNNYYCNYFNRNLFGIYLNKSILRNPYNSFYSPANYKKIVHGEIANLNQYPLQFVARDNQFILPLPGGAYINNDLIGNLNNIKWDFSMLNFNSTMKIKFLSDKTKNQFINHNNAINTCFNSIPYSIVLGSYPTDSMITCTDQTNEFDSFWINYYIAQKAQSGQLQVNNAIPFCNQLVTLQKMMDNATYTDIVNYHNSLQLNSQYQRDVHFIYGQWIQYLSHIDTLAYRPNKFGNIKQWITDSTYYLQNVLLDSFSLQTRFKPLSDSIINQIYNIAKLDASKGSPSVYFARN